MALFVGPATFAQQPAKDPAAAAAPSKSGDPTGPPATSGLPDVPTIQTDGTGAIIGDVPLPHDLSPVSMFLAADILVKAVMVSLMFASLLTWTILVAKTIELASARLRLAGALKRADIASTLGEARLALGPKGGFLAGLIAMAEREIEISAANAAGIKERCGSLFSELVRRETNGMRRGMGLLATIGATAPFVGLFGTVWGIMNAFIGISKAQTTNLAVVAPGIAEALLATAVGLGAAIPAVVIYNYFSQATRRYGVLVGRASGFVQRLLSRELDHRADAPARAE